MGKFAPSYRTLSDDELGRRAGALEAVLRDCTLCPHECRVDRTAGEKGFCRTGPLPFVSSASPHFGEEPPLVGTGGSGTIFFANCNLACVFCQNYSISQLGEGIEVTCERLAELMLSLEDAGCHNINLVTPTHQAPAIMSAVRIAAGRGLGLPLVYNSGGYESVETLRMLEGVVDIYMPDLKYADASLAERFSGAADYPEMAFIALKEMHRQVGDLRLDDRGIAVRGLLVRHLVLPGCRENTASVLRFIAKEISRDTYVNVMDQYHPCFRADEHPPLDRSLASAEHRDAVRAAREAGLYRIDGED